MKQISDADRLIGALAFEHVLLKFKPLTDDPEFRGAFHVLSGFTPEQLVAFIQCSEVEPARTLKLHIQFPRSELRDYEVSQSFLADVSAVDIRNRPRDGRITVAAEVESDVGASLADSDRTDASDLKDKAIAHLWIDAVAKQLKLTLLEEERRKAEAMVKGIFDTGRCPSMKVGEYLRDVLSRRQEGEPILRAAGKALPIIGLPRYEDCFSSLGDAKSIQPSQWRDKFKTHYGLECYLYKRQPSQELLDPEAMRKDLVKLREQQQPLVPDDLLTAFERYIESQGTRNPATEALLFGFDWSSVHHCFDQSRKTSSRDLIEKTRRALVLDGVNTTPEDEVVLEALKNESRRPGSASDIFREFFGRHVGSLENDPSLLVEWEDFVHGRQVQCTDLVAGLMECLQRVHKARDPQRSAYVVLEGKRQAKPNNFIERNQRACEFFERYYGSLPERTGKRIRFANTLAPKYSKSVLPHIRDHGKFKGTKKVKNAITLSFLAHVHECQSSGTDRHLASLSLSWEFPVSSVLAQETKDLDALCRYSQKGKTTLVECVADYEVVGRKGMATALSLENVDGFAEEAGAGGRGSFVPAQQKIRSLAAEWTATLAKAVEHHWVTQENRDLLTQAFDQFAAVYNEAIIALRHDALATERAPDVSAAYRNLLLAINTVGHEDARRQLLRIVLRVGLAQVRRSGRRAPVAVVCPWHPLRMEAAAARQQQVADIIARLTAKDLPPFSDGTGGLLFFRDVQEMLAHPLYPDIALVWEGTQATPRVVSQACGGYTLHQPAKDDTQSTSVVLDDEADAAAATVMEEIDEFLRLQPHERDNFSVLLYNCDSPNLPTAVVKKLNKINSSRTEDKITCQVLLMHRDEEHLRGIYRELVVRGASSNGDASEATGSFLSKVRVNITAANRLRRDGRSQPVDIAYCRDLISAEAKDDWRHIWREVVSPTELYPHQWSRRLPVVEGDKVVRLQLTCPAQTETGWAYLNALAVLCGRDADEAWQLGKCPVLMKILDFDDQRVDRIFRETHQLATWVVNQDELLDRKLLEAQHVKVIRYIQSATHGRNLIISSDARETLLVNTLREKLKAMLPSDTATEVVQRLCQRVMADANRISGGLVLKAARRANNTNELLGMVLSRYIVQSELGGKRPVAWCFLDDYSQWLGKKEGTNLADLLVLAPSTKDDGSMHLDVVVTEAKFVTYDALGSAANTSGKQLGDTLSQITEGLDGATETMDQAIWLARISDLLGSQISVPAGCPPLDAAAWRRAIRGRQCTARVWGYSHVFVYGPSDLLTPISATKGIKGSKVRPNIQALQEIFGPEHVRNLLLQLNDDNYIATRDLRLQNGHTHLGKFQVSHLAGTGSRKIEPEKPRDSEDEGGSAIEREKPRGPSPTQGTDNPIQAESKDDGAPVPQIAVSACSLLHYLETRSKFLQRSEDNGKEWLVEVTFRLRQALVSRGLPAKLAEGLEPMLTPNAGIIKLQGSKDLTVQAVESRAEEIYTSEGLKIISTTPEAGRISIAVERPSRQILYTEPVLLNYLQQYPPETRGEKLLVGVREEDGQPMLLDPFVQPHTLIAGMTGSGKSVLLQNIILSIAATRSPDQTVIYLIDPKFGGDFRPLDELPHIQAGSHGIIDDSAAAIELLSSLVDEMNRRYRLFKEARVPNSIQAYRRSTGKPLPTIWVIHDEFADWMQTEEYRGAVPDIVGRLSIKARAAGIFLIFAAQRPEKDVMPMQLRSQLGNRLILKVDNAATSEIALGEKNGGAERLLGHGHMLAKTGETPHPVYVQVPFVDIEKHGAELVQLITGSYAGNVARPPSV